jgi:Tfp pilus assembly protein FimV
MGGMIEQAFVRTSAGADEAGPGEAGRMRLTRRGRILVRALAVVLVVAGFMLVAPGLARGDGPERPAPRVTYVVESGDTLWSIARRVAPGQDPRPVVDGLIEANHLRGGLQVGQELSISVPER